MSEYTGTIKAVTGIKVHDGIQQIGFLMGDRWFNVKGTEQILTEMTKIVKKGNEIGFDLKEGFAENFDLLKEGDGSDWSDDMISFEELLTEIHKPEYKLRSIKTELISHDFDKGYALVKATVTLDDDRSFEGHGDGTQENCSTLIKKHYIRMAETRAIARAIRWATNNAKTAEEETE